MSGVGRIAAERQRQIEAEGFDLAHDDHYEFGELAVAAVCYAMNPDDPAWSDTVMTLWPWAPEWFRPSPERRIRDLEKAGALIAAEIDRLERAEVAVVEDGAS